MTFRIKLIGGPCDGKSVDIHFEGEELPPLLHAPYLASSGTNLASIRGQHRPIGATIKVANYRLAEPFNRGVYEFAEGGA